MPSLSSRARFGLVVIAVCTGLIAPVAGRPSSPAHAATFVVNSTSDADVCGVPTCTLRGAISAANAAPGLDTISFNISPAPPNGYRLINIGSVLPTITDPVIVDATTQPGYAGIPNIRIEGIAPTGTKGLVLSGALSGTVVRGLAVTGFDLGDGVELSGTGITFERNYVGLYDLGAGPTAAVNGSGIIINGGGGHLVVNNVVNSFSNCVALLGATSANTIRGNYLGTNPSGAPLGGCGQAGVNPGYGITLDTGAASNVIGGVASGQGNLISLANDQVIGAELYGGQGVALSETAGSGNRIRGNSTYSNDLLGVDLGSTAGLFAPITDGVTPNDAMDADVGPNGRQNFPIVSSSITYGGGATLMATLNSTPLQSFAVDAYGSGFCDPSGYGEGEGYLGSIVVATDSSGDTAFSMTVPWILPYVTLTATSGTGSTSEFSPCHDISNESSCGGDFDCDTVLDAQDNCPSLYNPLQTNTDRNFIDQTPPSSQDDRTVANSDALGDACDSDDDNDGLVDGAEFDGCNGSAILSPSNGDSDGDRTLDGAECALGSNPTSAASKPTPAQCGSNLDADSDRLSDRAEVCGYNTDPNDTDTDGDLDGFPTTGPTKDGCEAASLNGDRTVNSGDQLLLVLEILREPSPSLRLVSMDINKDGGVNSGDQLLVAQFLATSGQCP